jgi:eukaryotic-like serine/threonine-protein kinase
MATCPQCQTENPEGAPRCNKCGFPFVDSGGTVVMDTGGTVVMDSRDSGATQMLSGAASFTPASQPLMQPGSLLAERYEIVKMLGQGGMGAVYKALDRELSRTVAIKTIRPELASQPQILERFKQEVALASQITHPNVIRIYDLGSAGDLRFLSMEYVEGRELHEVMAREKLAPHEAAEIIRQVCLGLEAAHAKNVIHRDLKPQNVMVDPGGRIAVMDFGMAHSMESSGLTRTGMIMGTPDFMSPEQALGQKVDHRSDIFSLGVILFQMLTGKVPFESESMIGTLVARTREQAKAPIEVDPSVPPELSAIVAKCMALDPAGRYESVSDIITDLDHYLGKPERPASARPTIMRPVPVRPSGTVPSVDEPAPQASFLRTTRGRVAIGAGVLVVVLGAGVYFRERLTGWGPSAPPQPMTVVVSDFKNTTGEPVFNGTIEPALTTALEGATFLSAYNRGDARRVAQQLQPGATALDEPLAKLVAVRQGLGVVISGTIAKDSKGYQLTVRAVDPFTNKVITSSQLDGISRDGVLTAAAKLAADVRKALRDDTPESLQIAAAETFSAGSLEAAHEYAMGEQAEWAGKTQDAIAAYSKAVELDPNLGRAYANIAAMYANQGQREDADKFHQLAMTRIDRMSDREKYKTRGLYFLLTRNDQKAVEELNSLVKQYPSDGGGLQNLSYAYFDLRDFQKALEMGRRASALQPKNVSRRNNVAFYALYAGDFETAIREARGALELNPKYAKAYLVLALAQIAQGKPAEAALTYQKLDGVSPLGASLASIGLADLALYEGRVEDAVTILKKGIAQDEEAKNSGSAAIKWAALAQAELLAGRKGEMQAAAEKALAASDSDDVRVTVARTYVQAGLAPQAMAIAAKLAEKSSPDAQAYAKLIDGEVELSRGNPRDALKSFQDAQKLADTWLGRFDLARADFESGKLIEANSELDVNQKRIGEATAAFLDDIPTTRYLPELYYYEGRVREGLKSPGAAESYRNYLAIKQKAANDPLVKDARRRVQER